MQLDLWLRAMGETSRERSHEHLSAAVQCKFVHFVQPSVHHPREVTLDEKAFTDNEAHETADCAVIS